MRGFIVLIFAAFIAAAVAQNAPAPAPKPDQAPAQAPATAGSAQPQCGKNEVYRTCLKPCNARTCANYKLKLQNKQQAGQTGQHGQAAQQPPAPAPGAPQPAKPTCTAECTPAERGCDCADHYYRNAANLCVSKDKCFAA